MVTEDAKEPEYLPRLQLDELLEELQVQVDTVRGTRDRIHHLLEAVLSVGRGLELSQVLHRIVEAAADLVDAEYGALGVIGEDRMLARFVTVGVSDEQVRDIGGLPAGHGILGELIRHPQPLRLPEIAGHPASYGFPPNHPAMHSFLGVPIKVRDEVFGNLYLTQKRTGGEFDAEDESVLSTLAVAAGVAIENARLYGEARQRQRWLEAGAQVTRALLSGVGDVPVLEMIVSRACGILGAELGAVAFPVGETGGLRVATAVGKDAGVHDGLVLPAEGTFMGLAFRSEEPVYSSDIAHDPRVTAGPPRWSGLGPAVAAPMGTGDGVRGVLLLARTEDGPVFTRDEVAPLLGFAGQAALAMELADRRHDAEEVALYEDRDRIARDLHDLAIQRLFATGMTLQSALRFARHPEAAERLSRAVDDLDETIKIIRSTIFGLRAHEDDPASSGLRARTVQRVRDAVPALGFTPVLRMEGLIDTGTPRAVADDVVAALTEALSNVVRHARATSASVFLDARSGGFTLTVTDDGVGLPEDVSGSGLRNLAERAERRGGTLALDSPPGGGTRIVWHVPLPTS